MVSDSSSAGGSKYMYSWSLSLVHLRCYTGTPYIQNLTERTMLKLDHRWGMHDTRAQRRFEISWNTYQCYSLTSFKTAIILGLAINWCLLTTGKLVPKSGDFQFHPLYLLRWRCRWINSILCTDRDQAPMCWPVTQAMQGGSYYSCVTQHIFHKCKHHLEKHKSKLGLLWTRSNAIRKQKTCVLPIWNYEVQIYTLEQLEQTLISTAVNNIVRVSYTYIATK